MDDSGRLHMPGFVGKTFEQTGVKKFGGVASSLIADEIDEAAREAVEGAGIRGAADPGMNRKGRRKMASEMTRRERVG